MEKEFTTQNYFAHTANQRFRYAKNEIQIKFDPRTKRLVVFSEFCINPFRYSARAAFNQQLAACKDFYQSMPALRYRVHTLTTHRGDRRNRQADEPTCDLGDYTDEPAEDSSDSEKDDSASEQNEEGEILEQAEEELDLHTSQDDMDLDTYTDNEIDRHRANPLSPSPPPPPKTTKRTVKVKAGTTKPIPKTRTLSTAKPTKGRDEKKRATTEPAKSTPSKRPVHTRLGKQAQK